MTRTEIIGNTKNCNTTEKHLAGGFAGSKTKGWCPTDICDVSGKDFQERDEVEKCTEQENATAEHQFESPSELVLLGLPFPQAPR